MAKLVVVSEGRAGLSHELTGSWITIGRAEGNAFRIEDLSVSGRHCEVRLRGEELMIRDLCSTNGTFVQGRGITEAVLKLGQALRVGDVTLRFDASAPKVPSVYDASMPVVSSKTKLPPEAGEESAKKYQVLFVDDSMAFLETFTELCGVLANQTWEVHSATSADRALAILQQNSVDLVVLDLGIPVVDGLQLLGIIARRYPGLKVAVLTGKPTDTNRATCLANGAELFIEKPVSADGMKVVFNMLNDLVSWTHREGFSGTLRQVGLQEVIQMECIGRRSVILEIRNQQMRGQIYIEDGSITHAAVGNLVGEKAFNRLLSLTGGEFQLKPFKSPPQRTVREGWESLLMEAARCCDEETVLIARRQIEGAHAGLGDDVVVVATYDGNWIPVDGAK